jgi:hypothetical protein
MYRKFNKPSNDAASEDGLKGPKHARLLCKQCYFTLEGKYMNNTV